MRPTRVLPLVLASALTLAATGCGSEFRKDSPKTAVRDFLSVALARDNGQQACDWMTQQGQQVFDRTQQPPVDPDSGQACRQAMEKAQLIGDKDDREVNTTGEVKDLDYSSSRSGNTATVTVKAKGGRTLNFKLVKSKGLGNLYEPGSPWRISDGAEGLVQQGS